MNKDQMVQAGIFAGVFAAGAVTMRVGQALTNTVRMRRARKAEEKRQAQANATVNEAESRTA